MRRSSDAPVACQDDLPDFRAHRAFKVSAHRLHHVRVAPLSEEGLSLDIDLPQKVALASIRRELEDAISMTAHEVDPPRQWEGDHLSHEHLLHALMMPRFCECRKRVNEIGTFLPAFSPDLGREEPVSFSFAAWGVG